MVKVTIVYPTDPLGKVPGGTDTCIRDLIRYAPDDIFIKLVGVTTDQSARPVNQITRCVLSAKEFEFAPVLAFASLDQQMRLPLSLRFTLALIGKDVTHDASVLQFHRIEPSFLFLNTPPPKIHFIHQHMKVLRQRQSDIRWKHFPQVYYALEKLALRKAQTTFVVREDAVNDYRATFPHLAGRFQFLPTWMNPDLFFPLNPKNKRSYKTQLVSQLGWDSKDIVFMSVGRIDSQKNPHMLIDAIKLLKTRVPNARLIWVGDGRLKPEIQAKIAAYHLADTVRLWGVLKPDDVAELMRCADAMVLSSSYEGMPRCVVEALGSGVPVVATEVGEVPRIVHHGRNGLVVSKFTPEALAGAMEKITHHLEQFSGSPCWEAVRDYTAPVILRDLYNVYRRLGTTPP